MTGQPRCRALIYHYESPATVPDDMDESLPAPASAQALNRAAREAREEFLLLAPSGSRLTGELTARSVRVLDDSPGTLAVYPAHTSGEPGLRPLISQGPFRPALLMRRNTVGPVAVVRRSAWEELGGLRPSLASGQCIGMALWDFWLRLVLAHPLPASILRLPALLAQCPPGNWHRRGDDGRAKALLVVHTPGAFDGDVCRWAMALLRGESWARPHTPGTIPNGEEVRRMWERGRRVPPAALLHSA